MFRKQYPEFALGQGPSRRALIRGSLALGAVALLSACGTAATATATTASTVTATVTAAPVTVTAAPVTVATTVTAAPVTVTASAPSAPAKAGKALRIMTWTTGSDNAYASTFWASYTKTHADTPVEVDILAGGGNAGDQPFLVAVAGGAPPDLFWTGRSAIAGWGIKGVAMALDDRIAKSKVIRKDNFIANALTEGGWKGKTYGLYWSADARALYWNKDLFQTAGLDPEKPPQTWNDLTTAIAKLTKTAPDGSIQQLGIHPTYDSVGGHYWEAWFWELGGSYLSADGTKVTIANDQGVGALDWMVKQAQTQGGWNKIATSWTAITKAAGAATSTFGWGFGLNKVAMYIEVGDVITTLKEKWPSVHYGLAGIPAAATGKRASVRGGYFWVVAGNAPKPDVSWDYLEWVFAPDQILAFNNHFNRIPTTLDALNGGKWLPDNPTARQVFSEVVNYSQRIPCIAPGYAQILTVNGGIPTPVLQGKATAQDELANAQTQIQGILDKALKG